MGSPGGLLGRGDATSQDSGGLPTMVLIRFYVEHRYSPAGVSVWMRLQTITKKDSAGDLEVTRLCVYVIADKTELSNYMAAQMEVEFMIAS